MTSTDFRQDEAVFGNVRLRALATEHEQLEVGFEDGFGESATEHGAPVSMIEVHGILDRIADELKRLEGDEMPLQRDTMPELDLDHYLSEEPAVRPLSPTALVDRLSRMVETIRTLETTAYDAGQHPLADGLSVIGRRFEDTLWMMVVNIRDAMLAHHA
jgi:hypothetical protein